MSNYDIGDYYVWENGDYCAARYYVPYITRPRGYPDMPVIKRAIRYNHVGEPIFEEQPATIDDLEQRYLAAVRAQVRTWRQYIDVTNEREPEALDAKCAQYEAIVACRKAYQDARAAETAAYKSLIRAYEQQERTQ